MQVLTGDHHDACHELDLPGAYEWWYVDGLSADGAWGFVAILFRGMPMSPDYLAAQARGTSPHPLDHCGVALSVYHRGARVYQAFRGMDRAACAFGVGSADVVVGPCTFRRMDAQTWALHMETDHPDQPRGVTLDAVITRSAVISNDETPFTSDHGWVLVAPCAQIDATVIMREDGNVKVRTSWHGTGYHDHNMGRRAMQQDFDTWLWGRCHGANATTVYLATPDATEPCAWVGTFDASGLHVWSDVNVEASSRSITWMGLPAAQQIAVRGSGGTIDIHQTVVLDDGPFYRRYLSDMHDGPSTVQGITEEMHVRRFRSAWIRPLLRTPWLRQ